MHQSRTRRIAVLAVSAAAAAAFAPQAASAAVVSQANGVVTYQAAAGEVNQPIPFVENGRLRVREANAATPLSAGLGCRIVSDRLADCDSGTSVRISLGDRDDDYFGTGAGSFGVTVNGEDGNDVFIDGDGAAHREIYIGGAGVDKAAYFLESRPLSLSLDNQANDGEAGEGDFIASDVESLQGGQSDDVISGNNSANHLAGEQGRDRLSGLGGDDSFEEGTAANGADTFSGGTGIDRVLYRERSAGAHVSIDNVANDGQGAEADNVLTNVENITGTPFADTLTGSTAANTLAGLGGNDFIDPLGGADTVFGGDGDDHIVVKDGVKDVARGNAGSDLIQKDSIDDAVA